MDVPPAQDEAARLRGEGNLSLRPLKGGDREALRGWLALPAVRLVWGSRATADAEVGVALASESAICRMIDCDGAAIGYAHALDCALIGGDHASVLPPGTWDCAVLIASQSHRGKGYGGRALARLVDDVFQTTFAQSCVIRVPVASEAAVRAVEAAGFRWVRISGDPGLGPVWVMQAERPAR